MGEIYAMSDDLKAATRVTGAFMLAGVVLFADLPRTGGWRRRRIWRTDGAAFRRIMWVAGRWRPY